jgi:RNA polymerase sigma-70 factor, ECF subfamily
MSLGAAEAAALEADIASRLDAGDHAGAATRAIRGYGPQILGYLASILRDDAAADDVFAAFCEDLWRGIPQFRGASLFRTWAYRIAWHAALAHLREPFRRRGQRLGTEEAGQLAAEVRTTTALHLRSEGKDALAAMREGLSHEDQALLHLRVDREMSWSEIADVLGEENGERSNEAALRKRFERLKETLRREAARRGLLPE